MVIFSKGYSSNIAIYKIQKVKIQKVKIQMLKIQMLKIQNINYYYFVFCIIWINLLLENRLTIIRFAI